MKAVWGVDQCDLEDVRHSDISVGSCWDHELLSATAGVLWWHVSACLKALVQWLSSWASPWRYKPLKNSVWPNPFLQVDHWCWESWWAPSTSQLHRLRAPLRLHLWTLLKWQFFSQRDDVQSCWLLGASLAKWMNSQNHGHLHCLKMLGLLGVKMVSFQPHPK